MAMSSAERQRLWRERHPDGRREAAARGKAAAAEVDALIARLQDHIAELEARLAAITGAAEADRRMTGLQLQGRAAAALAVDLFAIPSGLVKQR